MKPKTDNTVVTKLKSLIKQAYKSSNRSQLATIGTQIGALVIKNPKQFKNAHVSHDLKAQALALILRSKNNDIVKNRKYLIQLLSFKNFANHSFKNVSFPKALSFARETQNGALFKDLLNHPLALNDKLIADLSHEFYPDKGSLMNWDLFHKLNPTDYRNKPFAKWTPYEKLYFTLYETYYTCELSHRNNLKGNILMSLGGEEKHVPLEGQNPGFSLIQFKDHLLQFFSTHDLELSSGFKSALERILELTPQSGIHILNKKKNADTQLFLFNHVNHAWTAILADNKLYMINMGLGSQDEPGIHIYDVPAHKIQKVSAALRNLEKTDLMPNLLNMQNANDKETYQAMISDFQKQYQQRMEFKHYQTFAKEHDLKKREYIHVPQQPGGHCSYYSLKGLLLALAYHNNQKQHKPNKAYQLALRDFLSFVNYDYHHAVNDYVTQVLRPNPKLLMLAKHQLTTCHKHADPTLDKQKYRRIRSLQ